MSGIRKTGRATQGVKAMNVREGDHISAVALVVESASPVAGEEGLEQEELTPVEPGEESPAEVAEDAGAEAGEAEAVVEGSDEPVEEVPELPEESEEEEE